MKRSSGPIGRGLCVLALLLGLVGMHGLANGPDDGCHGGIGSPAAITTMVSAVPAGPLATPHLVAAMRGMGSACVFVQAVGWPGLALALLAIAGLVAASDAGARWFLGGRPGRSPPLAGVSLLRWVCVSLT